MLGLTFYDALRESRLRGFAPFFNRVLRLVLSERDDRGDQLLPGLRDLKLDLSDEPELGGSLLESNRVTIEVNGTSLTLPAEWLSDGYQAMLAWVADLLGHALLDSRRLVDLLGFEGIVLLDEVDLHLHPTWQRRVVPILKRVFPKLQFVVTTHSPLVLAGFEGDEIISLRMENGHVIQDPAGIEPGVLTASELLTNFFDVQHAGRPELVEDERRYLELQALESPRPEQLREREELRAKLEPYWTGSGATENLLLPANHEHKSS